MNLPKVFQNSNIKNTNRVDLYYSKEITKQKPYININDKINNIFKDKRFVYKINVTITTKDNQFDTSIIGKTYNNLITLDNKLINIKDIIDINIKTAE